MLTSPAARRLSAGAALAIALVGSVVLAAPAQAAETVVRITADGLVPRQLTIARGDTVVLVNDDASFRYRARSTTGNWSFDSGLIPLAGGVRYALPEITGSGTYGFTAFQGVEPFNGAVVLPAPGSSPAAVGSDTPEPSATGGTGEPSPAPAVVTAVSGDLPGAGTSRGYGLPVVLAAVLAAGIASLLVRLLLAEPRSRRAVVGLPGPAPVATVD